MRCFGALSAAFAAATRIPNLQIPLGTRGLQRTRNSRALTPAFREALVPFVRKVDRSDHTFVRFEADGLEVPTNGKRLVKITIFRSPDDARYEDRDFPVFRAIIAGPVRGGGCPQTSPLCVRSPYVHKHQRRAGQEKLCVADTRVIRYLIMVSVQGFEAPRPPI